MTSSAVLHARISCYDLDDCGNLRAVEFIRILTAIKFCLVEKGLGDGLAYIGFHKAVATYLPLKTKH
jgi:hypothetical protein